MANSEVRRALEAARSFGEGGRRLWMMHEGSGQVEDISGQDEARQGELPMALVHRTPTLLSKCVVTTVSTCTKHPNAIKPCLQHWSHLIKMI
jgi:hypothetical protein